MKRKVKNLTNSAFMLAFGLLLSIACYGQEGGKAKNVSGGIGYSVLGTSFLNLNSLNSMLQSNGYPVLSENFFTAGGGGHAIVNRIIIGGEGYSLMGEDVLNGSLRQSVYASTGFFDIGYIALSYKGLNVFPMLGIGGGEMIFKIREDISSISFGDILNDPRRAVELKSECFLLDFGGGINYILGFGKNESARAGFLLGIRGGYTLTPFRGKWLIDDIEVSGAPKAGINGPYIRIMIGGGAISSY